MPVLSPYPPMKPEKSILESSNSPKSNYRLPPYCTLPDKTGFNSSHSPRDTPTEAPLDDFNPSNLYYKLLSERIEALERYIVGGLIFLAGVILVSITL